MPRLGVGIGLVGRRREVSVLVGALDRAAAARPSAVLLSGDAGVGKSRLVAEAAGHATAAGFTVLVGRCLDAAESSLPYLPFTEIVATLAATHTDLVAGHVALGHLLPGNLPSAGWSRAEQVGEDRDLGQVRVFDAVLSVLDDLAATTPVLLVLEDLHWADRSSRDLLVFLLSRLGTQRRLLVLATYRGDDLHRRHPLRPVLSELVRLPATERIELAPLDAADSLELVRLLADGSLAEPMLHRVARRSEGNAFFAEELVSASSDGVPRGLAEVLLARVEGLTSVTQRVLRIASVAGRRVRHDRLATVSGLGVDELEQSLREAVTHHVLVADTDDDAYSFRHALLREAIYHELLPGERSRLHAAYAALLADPSAAGGTGAPGRAAELAHHAMAGHDLPLALAASVRAAIEANDREAPAEMLLHAERAMELWPAVPDAEAVAGVAEATVTRWAAWGASATGDPDRGIALGRRALELAEAGGDAQLTSSIARRYALRLLELDGHAQEARETAQRALDLVVHGPRTADLAWAHAALARVYYRIDRFADAVRHAEAALTVTGTVPVDGPDHLSAVGATADALVTLAGCDEYGARPERARQRLSEAKPLARRSGNLGVELRAHFAVGMSLLDSGLLAEAGDEFAAGEERADATGTTWSSYGLELRVAHVIARFLRGDWDAAAEIAGESISATVASRLAAAGLLVAVARGRFAAAERRRDELLAAEIADERVILLLGEAGAESALWQSHPAEAARRVADALAGLEGFMPFHLAGITLAAFGIAAQADLAADGQVPSARAAADARALLDVAELAAERGMPRGGTLGPEGRAWLERARAELTRFDAPDPRAWSRVVDAFGYETGRRADPEAPLGYRQAYGLLRRAEAILARGQSHESAAADLRAALATADALGAGPLGAAVRALAERAGVPLASAAGPSPFTPRERSVLALVAQGQTNRQVGAALFISEKTVSVHLSRVMAKLGAGSRTEAVGIAWSRGLLAPADRDLARSDP